MESSEVDEILAFIRENEDVLYVVVGLLATLFLGGAIAIKIKSSAQKIKSGSDSTNIQAGRDVNLRNNSDDGGKD